MINKKLFHFRFRAMEASNYDDCRLIIDRNILRRRKNLMARWCIKHVTMIGVVKIKCKKKDGKAKKSQPKKDHLVGRAFLSDEAVEVADEEEDDDDDDDDEDDDDDDDDDEIEDVGFSDSDDNSDSEEEEEEEEEELVGGEDVVLGNFGRKRKVAAAAAAASCNDLEEQLVRAEEEDHTYSCVKLKRKKRPKNRQRYTYNLLYAVAVSGKTKQIKNCLPAAVAILSNSKKLFLGHINVMLKSLDPGLAEICYIDTDSAIFSLTYKNLEDCLRPEMKDYFSSSNILANEEGEQSCHGKMKLEGTFRAGQFKAIKIYRLFEESEAGTGGAVYTRCKGVNRWLAKKLPDSAFDSNNLSKIVVHRSALRPNRTGEMLITHESRSLAAPFNLKRSVTADGYHTFPLSCISVEDNEDDDNN